MNTERQLSTESVVSYQNSISATGRSTATAKAYGSDLKCLLEWAGRDISLAELEATAATWLNETRQEVSPSTTNRRLTAIRGFARWAGLTTCLSEYKPPKGSRAVPHPIPEGMEGVFRMCEEAANDQHRALFAMQGLLGMRVSEALSIRPKDIDVANMQVTVRGKGDVTRTIPLSERAWAFIRPATEDAITTQRPRVLGMSDRGARAAVTATGERLGFQRAISSHDLRATLATGMYDKTKDLRAVQEVLGHASSTTTEIYTMVAMTTMRDGMNF